MYIDLKRNGQFISSIAPKSTLQTINYDENNKYRRRSKSVNKTEVIDSIIMSDRRFKVELNFNPFGDEVFSFENIQLKYVLNEKTS